MAKTSEPIALIDLDGTLADFDGAMKTELAKLASPGETGNIGLPLEAVGYPRVDWDDGPSWLAARRDLIKRQPGFWRNLPKIQSGFDVLGLISEVGFQPTILTKGPFRTTSAWSEKVEWCREHTPDTPVIVCEDKGLVYGKVLFDDWPSYITRWLEWRPRGLVIMLDWAWNQGFEHPNVFRYRGFMGQEQKDELRKRLIQARDR